MVRTGPGFDSGTGQGSTGGGQDDDSGSDGSDTSPSTPTQQQPEESLDGPSGGEDRLTRPADPREQASGTRPQRPATQGVGPAADPGGGPDPITKEIERPDRPATERGGPAADPGGDFSREQVVEERIRETVAKQDSRLDRGDVVVSGLEDNQPSWGRSQMSGSGVQATRGETAPEPVTAGLTTEATRRLMEDEAGGQRQQEERLGDWDWSFGLGGEEDEVEQAVDSIPGRVRGATRPTAKKLFSEDVAGESGGHATLSFLGFEQRADQYDEFIRGAGVGLTSGVAEGASSIPAGGLETVELFHEVKKGRRDTVTEIPDVAGETAEQSYEIAKERPGETAGALVGGYALGGAPGAGRILRTTRSGAGKAARGIKGRAGTRDFGSANRGQLDLTGPSSSRSSGSRGRTDGDSGSSSDSSTTVTADDLTGIAARSDPTRGGRFPSGTSGRANVEQGIVRSRDTGDVPSGGASTSLGYRTASSELDTAARVPDSATQTAAQTAVQTDPQGLVSGALSRSRAAATPTWMGGSVLPRGEEDTSVPDYANVSGPLLAEQAATGMLAGQRADSDTESMMDEAQAPAVTDDTDTAIGTDEDASTRPGQDVRTRPGTKTPTDTDTPQTFDRIEPFPQSPQATRPTRPNFATPRPSRPRRPRTPDQDEEFVNLDFDGEERGAPTVDRSESRTQPGWYAETVTDIGTLGMELPGTPSQSELESVSDPVTSASDLPTSQVFEGDEDVLAAADMLGGGVDVNLDFDLGGGGV